ncbi:MAG: hypothetical protein ACRELE_06915 [Gemmatimonadales bacterium]
MDTAHLSTQSIENILSRFDEVAASQGPAVPAVAALSARLTRELTGSLNGLTDMVFTAKRQMVERMDALAVEIKSAQLAMGQASREASETSKALVKWTKVLVAATIAYTVITGGLLLVAILHNP